MLAGMALLTSVSIVPAQTESPKPKPYASINREAINYFGPGREASADLEGPEIKIGILAPLNGSAKIRGEALIQAAEMALEDESRGAFDGRKVVLALGDSTGPWGSASREIVRLVFDERAVALITFSDGNLAHLAEQVGNREGVPVLTLSSDSTTTEINIPWLFRVVPSDDAQARIFARNIYDEHRLTKVLLVTEHDHDGRVGGEAFQKAAREMGAAPPGRVEISAVPGEFQAALARIKTVSPEALVFWTGPETAERLRERIREDGIRAPVYLCLKAAHESVGLGTHSPRPTDSGLVHEGVWAVSPLGTAPSPTLRDFAQRYAARTGKSPSLAAAETYDAVRLVIQAVSSAGPNRARVRDRIAKVTNFQGASGTISFDGAGNARAGLTLVELVESSGALREGTATSSQTFASPQPSLRQQ